MPLKKLTKSLIIKKIWYIKWIHSFEPINPSLSLQFIDNFLYLTLFQFPVLSITAPKLNFMWFHWNQSTFFWNQAWFQQPFSYFCWFQYGFIETILVNSQKDYRPKKRTAKNWRKKVPKRTPSPAKMWCFAWKIKNNPATGGLGVGGWVGVGEGGRGVS